MNRGQDLIDKYVDFAKENGTASQYKRALELELPSSPLYNFLEGRVPHPALTYSRVIEIAEAEEKQFINREIGERRTRLGARIDQVVLDVKREAYARNDLEQLYRGIVDWSNDDEVRRSYEEKLLQRAYDILLVLPSDAKYLKRDEVFRAARDMVIIKHPFEHAWKIVLEWQDIESFLQWDVGFLNEFIEFFPEDGVSKVLKGFLGSKISPFPKEAMPVGEKNKDKDRDEVEEHDAGLPELADHDLLLLMVEGFESVPSSVVVHRIMAEVYLSLDEFESVIDVSRRGLKNIEELTKTTGLKLQNTPDALNMALANSLIFYQAPRHHSEAKQIFEAILLRKPTLTACLLGVGLILKVDEDYVEAINFLQRALDRDPSNIRIRGELYWCKALYGDLESGLHGLQDVLSVLKTAKQDNRDFRSEILYRIGYCQWELDPSYSARRDRQGAYAYFLASIQANINYAPAYTSLGIYYADYKKDVMRARRCFHKAFELSPSEIEAAERLAKSFADQKEWDLVEAVAQRVVDSGKAKPSPGSKRKGYSWPYAALGTVQITKQQYFKSIVSFQAALRISPRDYHSWVGLGESYHHSGRFIAATKSFEQAQALEVDLPDAEKGQVWFAHYMLANVKRELGEYEDAVSRYVEVLSLRPTEVGVNIALLQTLVEDSWKNLQLGLFDDTARLACKAFEVATSLAHERVDIFNLWKSVGDACSIFSYIKSRAGRIPFEKIAKLLDTRVDVATYDIFAELDGVGEGHLALLTGEDDEDDYTFVPSNRCLYAAILAYKRAVRASSQDVYAQAVGWYNLGWAEYRAHRCLQIDSSKKAKKQLRSFLTVAVRCFKRAIESEAGNSEFWNALGVVTTKLNPKVAQHAFVRSLHLNDRIAQVWTNLGVLYLLHNDVQLSNEALTRAQSSDPDYSLAWTGQGFLALLYGDPVEARGLFEHAFDISSTSSAAPKRQYTLSLFDRLMTDSSMSNEITELIQPLFALHQLCCQDPSDLPFVHLTALLAERTGEYSDARSRLKTVCSKMEAEYEVSESTAALVKFVQANADAARIHLANQEYEQAAERAETALTLSGEEDEWEFDRETGRKLRLSAHLTAGLAHYYLTSMDSAIDMFRDALQEADNAPEVVCLLAQVLWAKGGEEERNVAREQLFGCVERYPDDTGAVALLGAISLIDADEDAIEAVKSDLESMRTRDDVGIHDRARLLKLLTAISAMGFGVDTSVPEETRCIGQATIDVMLSPGQPQGWMELSVSSQEVYPAEMAVKRALRNVPPYGNLEANDISEALSQTGRVGDAFRAINLAPWRRDSWEELGNVLSEV